MEKLFKQIKGKLPKDKGWYITNFGNLEFDGKKFLVRGHKNPVPTIIDWYMEEVKIVEPVKLGDDLDVPMSKNR